MSDQQFKIQTFSLLSNIHIHIHFTAFSLKKKKNKKKNWTSYWFIKNNLQLISWSFQLYLKLWACWFYQTTWEWLGQRRLCINPQPGAENKGRWLCNTFLLYSFSICLSWLVREQGSVWDYDWTILSLKMLYSHTCSLTVKNVYFSVICVLSDSAYLNRAFNHNLCA